MKNSNRIFQLALLGFGLIFLPIGIGMLIYVLNDYNERQDLNLMWIIFTGFGLLFTVPAIWWIMYDRKKNNKIESLRQNGSVLNARFISADEVTNLEVNGRHPYVFLVEGKNPLTGEMKIFKSEYYFNFDPNMTLP